MNNHKLQAHGEKIDVKRKVASISKSDDSVKTRKLETKGINRVSNIVEFSLLLFDRE